MTEKELLELLVNKVSNIETDMQSMKADMRNVKADMYDLKSSQKRLEEKVDKLEEKVKKVEDGQLLTQIQLENIVDKSLQVLLEGYHLSAEKFAEVDVNAIKQNVDYAVSIASIAYNEAKKKNAA